MELDRKTIAQVLVAVFAVALLITGLVVISTTYATNGADAHVTPEGGLYLVGLLAFFVVLMPALGYIVERMHPEENGEA